MPVCPQCYSRNLRKFGKYPYWSETSGKQKYHCKDCGFTTVHALSRKPKFHNIKVVVDNKTELKEALESMIFQFGYRGVKKNKPMIWTGGLSTLEEAFDVLGWDDPHYLPEQGYTCEVIGCMEQDTAGTHWGDNKLYLRLCYEHSAQAFKGLPMPPIKKWALDREAKRDPVTGILPLEDK